MVNIEKQINDYYWDKLEPNCNGYGNPYPLKKIEEKFNIALNWKQLHQIFIENGYKL